MMTQTCITTTAVLLAGFALAFADPSAGAERPQPSIERPASNMETTRTPKASQLDTANRGLNLTEAQERTIFQSIVNAEIQEKIALPVVVGTRLPPRVELKDIPLNVRAQVRAVEKYKFAKLSESEVLLVDPQNRTVVEIIDGQATSPYSRTSDQ